MTMSGARGIAVRLFFTVWLVYAIHLSSNVVRETYLAMAIGDGLSVRVDKYMDLHPDLFEIPGRGAYINNNPGASMLGAIPYALARPAISTLIALKPELARPKPSTTYDDPRPNRTKLMNRMRERGLDVVLALGAFSTQLGLMAPLGGLAAVILFHFFRARLRDQRTAFWLSLLFSFGTPLFFRAAFLNQNAIVGYCVLFAYVLLVGMRPREPGESVPHRHVVGAGALLALALLTDYSALPLIAAFGVWALAQGWSAGRATGAARAAGWMALGAALPIALLLGYQWAAFGSPWFPAQKYMPPTEYSVRGWNGLTLPTSDLLWRNLFDPRYGLFAFSPMLLLAFAAPFVRRDGGPTRGQLAVIFSSLFLLLLWNSANQFAHLQWNTGVRYMVPAAPLLFMALVPVLLRAPRWLAATAVIGTLVISWCVSMVREDVITSVSHVFLAGFTLPMLIVLEKTAGAYAPFLEQTGTSPIPLFCLVGVILWLVWRRTSLTVADEMRAGVAAPAGSPLADPAPRRSTIAR